jgi:ribosomal-protein-alanine N-acetyltransferase
VWAGEFAPEFGPVSPIVAIRPMVADDLDRVAEIYGAVFDPIQPRMAVAQYLTPPGAFALVAEISPSPEATVGGAASIAGFIIGQAATEEAEIFSVGVADAFRRNGAARALVIKICASMAALGATSVFLEVAVDNPGAIALYDAVGFEIVGRRKDYYRDPGGVRVDAMIMRLDFGVSLRI